MAYNKLSRYATWVRKPDADGSDLQVKYHSTIIVRTDLYAGRLVVTLDTNGWKGVTTKRKMNQASHEFNLGYSVHQHKHHWYVTTKAGQFEFNWRTFVFDAATGLPMDELSLFAPKMVAAIEERVAA